MLTANKCLAVTCVGDVAGGVASVIVLEHGDDSLVEQLQE